MQVPIYENILKSNDYLAHENLKVFNKHRVLAVGILGSPGAGKTTLMERTVERLLKQSIKPAVLVGDIASSRDAERLYKYQIPCAQLTTGGACHLEAQQVNTAVQDLPVDDIDILFIENVGNLVCPTGFGLGEHFRTVVFSVPEGDDKIQKYPATFRRADCVVLNKIDFLSFQEFSVDKVKQEARALNREIVWFDLSCKNGEGLQAWESFLIDKCTLLRKLS